MTLIAGHRPEQEQNQSNAAEKTTAIWWVRTIVSWALLMLMVGVLAVMVLIPRLTGSTAYTVLTGSMEPTMPPGTLIVVKPTPIDELSPGDVITFQPVSGEPAVVTHRINGIYFNEAGEKRVFTQGDANPVADSWSLQAEQIRGRVLYDVPYLGRMNSFINGQSRSILITVVAAGLGVYAMWMVVSGIRDGGKKKRKGTEDGEGDGSAQADSVKNLPKHRAAEESPATPAQTIETK